jgi:hypothetical protein
MVEVVEKSQLMPALAWICVLSATVGDLPCRAAGVVPRALSAPAPAPAQRAASSAASVLGEAGPTGAERLGRAPRRLELRDPDYREWLPALGSTTVREMSAPEAFARRWRREGLPLARLWQNESALLSLGLNPRGKPGLWLVQKTR